MSFGASAQRSDSSSQSNSAPLTAAELRQYFDTLDATSEGRLGAFATGQGEYRPISNDQLRSLGGAGASREAAALKARTDAVNELTADPSMSVFQRQRARQLTDNDYTARMDAIKKETEALQAAGASQQHDAYLKELELLANIFYGSKGQKSTSRSSADSEGYSMSGGWK